MSHIFDALNKSQPNKDRPDPVLAKETGKKSEAEEPETLADQTGAKTEQDAANSSEPKNAAIKAKSESIKSGSSQAPPAAEAESSDQGASEGTSPDQAKKEPYFQVGLESGIPKPSSGLFSAALTPAKEISPVASISGGLFDNLNPRLLGELDELRVSLESLMHRPDRQVIVFASSVKGEGSTTIAAHYSNLLADFAAKRVLLIDGDLSRSNKSLSETCDERDGLAELLQRDIDLDQVILRTEFEKLHFLPAGQDRINHVQASRSNRTRPLFDRLSKSYDCVVVDSPAILEHGEAVSLCSAGDGVVLVIKSGRTRRELAMEAMAKLNLARCRILGTVLNSHQDKIPGFLRERI